MSPALITRRLLATAFTSGLLTKKAPFVAKRLMQKDMSTREHAGLDLFCL
jgi:hypothetical protein